MKFFVKAALVGILLFALPNASAHAQAVDPYTNPSTPTHPPTDNPRGNTEEQCIPDDDTVDSDGPGGTDDEVLCDTHDTEVIPNEEEQGGGTVVVPGNVEEQPEAQEEQGPTSEIASAPTQAPTGSLPFTGGDVVGMTVIGAGALGIGLLMVRRSKAMKGSA